MCFKHCFNLRAVASFSENSTLLQRLASAGQAMAKASWSLCSEMGTSAQSSVKNREGERERRRKARRDMMTL